MNLDYKLILTFALATIMIMIPVISVKGHVQTSIPRECIARRGIVYIRFGVYMLRCDVIINKSSVLVE